VKLRVLAPAKINLTLRCLGRRPDGFTELDTTMAAIGLCDELMIEARPGTGRATLEVAGAPDVPSGDENLALRAARAVLAGRTDVDVHLRLAKAIPAGAGLGGGSSDAAAAAVGVARLIGPEARNADAAAGESQAARLAELGSDCPFFAVAASGLARCVGRGERVTPLPALRSLGVLVVTPDLVAPTARVYAEWRAREGAPNGLRELGGDPDWNAAALDELRAALVNDLEAPALRAVDGLVRWRALLDEHDLAHARLSGSGSSFFALFETVDDARAAATVVDEAAARADLAPRLVRAIGNANHAAQVLLEKRSG